MFVGVARVVLRLPGSHSLKDRRRVVKSYKERLRARLPVTVAEVGDVENHKLVSLGLCCVSAELGQCESILEQGLGMARVLRDAVLIDARHEVIPFGRAGGELRGGLEQALDDADYGDKYGEE